MKNQNKEDNEDADDMGVPFTIKGSDKSFPMPEKEFCLSDKILAFYSVIPADDVKEFIRLLHNENVIAKDIETTTTEQIRMLDWFDKTIDKLAGEELNGNN